MSATWLFDQGVKVFPLHRRSKEPACKWMHYQPTRLLSTAFENYGVPLGDVSRPDGTYDCWGVVDSDSPAAEAWVAANVPSTPFMVRTGKGWHRYFRLRRPVEKFLRRDGLTIEFRNQGQYVVGPGSVHPSGAVYVANDWSWNWEDIPYFPHVFVHDDGSCGHRTSSVVDGVVVRDEDFEFPDEVNSGERHDMLFRYIRSMKALEVSPEHAYEFVLLANETRCKPPLAASEVNQRWFRRGWDNTDRPIGRLQVPFVNKLTPDKDDL